ncbi:MAG: PqqD family protein [Candidatus Portnoybacteria bacterium]|nr:PqqD family protein [Candidatus Portnoybacteria bacterium]
MQKDFNNWMPRRNKELSVKRNINLRLNYIKEIQGSHVSYFLSKESSDIWDLINGRRTIRQITNELSKKYSSPKQQIYKDVCNFLLLATKKKLII